MKPTDAKKSMLLHSEAKVEFFKKYIQRYLRIVYLARSVLEINIFDVFCGTGVYENGKMGSPLVAFDAIKSVRDELGVSKPINLWVNDSQSEKVDVVKSYIDSENQGHCSVQYFNLDAASMFSKIQALLNAQSASVRNLIFIDPYGYKEIKKETLSDLLRNNRTEIILFLPISHMQRFTQTAVGSDLKPYEPLKRFAESFFAPDHPIRKQTVKPLEYIEHVKAALRFNQYYSTSYFIERDESNYYALFFISPHIYGFEKILEVKWQLDDESGRGFRQPTQPSLLDQLEREAKLTDSYDKLEQRLELFLATPKTNQEIYAHVLADEFLPKHAVQVFKAWQADRSELFSVVDAQTGIPARKGSFYINWDSYAPPQVPKVVLKLKRS